MTCDDDSFELRAALEDGARFEVALWSAGSKCIVGDSGCGTLTLKLVATC